MRNVPLLAFLLYRSASSLPTWWPVSVPQGDLRPPPTMSAITGAFANGTKFLLYGGCTSSCCFSPVDAHWELSLSPDLREGSWKQHTGLRSDGGTDNMGNPVSSHPSSAPSARFGAASAVDKEDDVLYAFGGQDSSQAFLSDMWAYNAMTSEWREIPASDRSRTDEDVWPTPRAAASLSVVADEAVGKVLVLVGGFGKVGAEDNQVWAMRLGAQARQKTEGRPVDQDLLVSEGWIRLRPEQMESGVGKESHPSSYSAAYGDEEMKNIPFPPTRRSSLASSVNFPARWHHVAVPSTSTGATPSPSSSPPSSSKAGLILVGGVDAMGEDRNEVYLMTFDWHRRTYAWRVLAMGTADDESITRLPVRHGHVALHSSSPSFPSFRIFGGLNTTHDTLPSSFLATTFRFDLPPIERWSKEDFPSSPGARAYAGVGHGEKHSIVVGGFAGFTGDTDDRLLDDVWVFSHGEEVEQLQMALTAGGDKEGWNMKGRHLRT